jgi:threonine dehydrogenase-like Zn-dependent dehydrogenase
VCLDAGAIAGGAPRKTGPAGIGPKKCGPHAVRSLVQSLPALFFAPILPVSFLIPPGFLRSPLAPQNRNAYKSPEIPKVLSQCMRVLKTNGRIVVVGMSKEGEHEPLIGAFEWAHKHFPNFIDCRPIYVREALEKADFQIRKALKKHMWIPVEIILGAKS